MNKRKAETCVWVKKEDGICRNSYMPNCNKEWRIYHPAEICFCGKKVEVKK
jgi:hypothetical protein